MANTKFAGVRTVCTMSKELSARAGEKILGEIKGSKITASFAPVNSKLKSPAVWFEVKKPASMEEIQKLAEKAVAKAEKKAAKKEAAAPKKAASRKSSKTVSEKRTYTPEDRRSYAIKKKDSFNQAILTEIKKQLLSAKAGTLAKTFQYQWIPGVAPHNGASGYRYRGINRILCNFWMWRFKSSDPRFFTGKQIYKLDVGKGLNMKIKDGEQGNTLQLEFWFLKDMTDNVVVQSAADRRKREEEGHRLVWCTRYIDVYNACQIENVPPMKEENLHEEVEPDDLVWAIADGMNVPLYMDTIDDAYYIPALDEIHVPMKERFKTDAGCTHTCLHELGHASGHKTRMNCAEYSRFGTEAYAKEEFRADMAALLLSAYTKGGLQISELKNSSAYIDSWLDGIENRPQEILSAFRKAANTADYMLAAAGYADVVPESELVYD